MGADGHILIWRDDRVRDVFPDCDKMFCLFNTYYCDELDGTKYHHCYYGDNIFDYWSDVEDWLLKKSPEVTPQRLKEFVDWLEKRENHTHWEVWT